MDDMVERVARAICSVNGYDPEPDVDFDVEEARLAGWPFPCRAGWHRYSEQARAAIEAIREPTRAMESAGRAGYGTSEQSFIGDAWRAMIDEALAPATTAERSG